MPKRLFHLLLLCAVPVVAIGQASGGPFEVGATATPGSARAEAGPFSVVGTIGHFNADTVANAESGPFKVTGGLVPPGAAGDAGDRIFGSGFE